MNWRLYREACHDAGLSEPSDKERARARLIAAAPELLEACNHALFLLSGLSTDGEITMTPEGKDRIQRELKAAIAKAEGHDDGNGNKQWQREGERER